MTIIGDCKPFFFDVFAKLAKLSLGHEREEIGRRVNRQIVAPIVHNKPPTARRTLVRRDNKTNPPAHHARRGERSLLGPSGRG